MDGDAALRRALGSLGETAPMAVARGLTQHAETVMTLSKQDFVPVGTGALRASGHVETPIIGSDHVSVTLGFGGPATPYALAVHENPRSGKTGGRSPSGKRYTYSWARIGEWKYLETPMKHLAPKVLDTLRLVIQRMIDRAAR